MGKEKVKRQKLLLVVNLQRVMNDDICQARLLIGGSYCRFPTGSCITNVQNRKVRFSTGHIQEPAINNQTVWFWMSTLVE